MLDTAGTRFTWGRWLPTTRLLNARSSSPTSSATRWRCLPTARHMFLTGKAGTGKSTLIRQFMANTDRNVVVVAPTGIAALNVDGYTIHRLFGFRTTTTPGRHPHRRHYRPGRFTKTLSSLHTLIIDEASMVRADLFDMVAAALERFGPAPGTPFGGVQIVLVGDLYQLPPVITGVRQPSSRRSTRLRTSSPPTISEREDFPTVALTTVFRQLGDDRMTAILNEIREGVLLGHAQEQLNARADADFVPPDGEFWLTLAPTNRLVSARNRQHLERLPGDEMVHQARQSGDLSLFDPPIEETLRFKVGAQIMMLNNDQGDRWVNGSIGRVIGVGLRPLRRRRRGRVPRRNMRRRRPHHLGGHPPCRRRRLASAARSSARSPSCRSSLPGRSPSIRAKARRWTGWSSTSPAACSRRASFMWR